jgi:PmbA protein
VAVLEKNEMLTIAEKIVTHALAKGASEAEAYVSESQAFNVGVELGQVNKSNQILDRGVGVRIVLNKAIGFAYTNIINDPTAVEDIVVRALCAARSSKPDVDWHSFPKKKTSSTSILAESFDSKILEISSDELVNMSQSMIDSALQVDKNVIVAEGGIGKAYMSSAVVNSNDIYSFDKGTIVECSLATLAKQGNITTPVCFEFNATRNLNIDPAWVGKETARLSMSTLKTKPVETKNTTLILTQFALQDLLEHTLVNVIRADSVQRGQSPFKGKIGTKIASEHLTIHDNGLHPSGMGTCLFDGEGVPQQNTLIIDKGVLVNFLYDNYTAKKEGKESTGNASRNGYLTTPGIDTTNLHITPGTTSPENLIQQVNDGLLIYYLQGAHSSNPVSGDFSVVATPVWKIKNGEITHASQSVMIAGNIFEVLKNIKTIGNNERQIGGLIAPWIIAENIRVIGK